MCGRMSVYSSADDLEKRFKAKFGSDKGKYSPNYNAPPSLDLPIITEEKPKQIELYRWGLVPHWAKDEKVGFKMINARAETILDKPSYRVPFAKQRCLVLTDGFYEWDRSEKKPQPYRFAMKDKRPFALAGIYERWKDASGKSLNTFSIVTTSANEQMEAIHDRMPVILHDDDFQAYLDPDIDPEAARQLLTPYDNEMAVYKVLKLESNPKSQPQEVLNSA